jgi:transitional endoplasmic reticulum ATPase
MAKKITYQEDEDSEERQLTDAEKDELLVSLMQKLVLQEELLETQHHLIDTYQQQIQELQKQMQQENQCKPQIDIVISEEETQYADIGGLDNILSEIKHFEYGQEFPRMYEVYGIQAPKGLLLHGPPGCGKTMIAKAMSNELDCWFMEVPLTQILSKYVGDAEKNLENVLERAKQRYQETDRKVIVFVDEAEQMFRKRGSSLGHGVLDRLVHVWLRTMDGMGSCAGLIFAAATNYVDLIDEAILRAGRFDYVVQIPQPDKDAVQDILVKQMRLKERNAGREIYKVENVPALADTLHEMGMNGADITDVLKRASLGRIKYFIENKTGDAKISKSESYIYDYDIKRVLSDYGRVQVEKKVGFR